MMLGSKAPNYDSSRKVCYDERIESYEGTEKRTADDRQDEPEC